MSSSKYLLYSAFIGAALFGCALLLSCTNSDKMSPQLVTDSTMKEKIVAVAKAYVAEKHPNLVSEFSKPVVVIESEKVWTVSWDEPNKVQGGAFFVEVDKVSFAVSRAYGFQ